MKIVADENIPFVHDLFDHFGEVLTCSGRNMASADVKNADVLLVRSVTPVNAELLQESSVRFVGTCTIGTDHLDTEYLDAHKIQYASAPGCNAYGVVQYVLASLANCRRYDLQNTVGIVGCGNVGGRLYRVLKQLGFKCSVYDPFLSKDDIEDLCEWDDVLSCDVISMHAPLTTGGPFPSRHMLDKSAMRKMQPDAFLLNAGRGAVIDNAALLEKMQSCPGMTVVLDVWENEPDLLVPLLEKVKIGTPHIAGYSFEGRTNGSLMIFNALAAFLGYEPSWANTIYQDVKFSAYGAPVEINGDSFEDIVLKTYQPVNDHRQLLAGISGLPGKFDELRKYYHQRREFGHYVIPEGIGANVKNALTAAGFSEG